MSSVTELDQLDSRLEPLTTCWICGASDWTPVQKTIFELENFQASDPELASLSGMKLWLRRCGQCTFIQPEALPRLPNYFDRLYDQKWPENWCDRTFDSTFKDSIFTIVLEELERRLPAERRTLLDIGAAVGKLIALAQRRGWKCAGIELNPLYAEFASKKTGAPIHRINAHSLADEGSRFDAVALIDVLEHIPDPVPVLEQCRRLLRAGGWLAVKVPCGKSQLLKERIKSLKTPLAAERVAGNLGHVNQFSPTSLHQALARAGFDQVTVTIGAPELFDVRASLINTVSRGIRLFTYRLSRLIPGGVHTPLAMNLQAYARAIG